MSCFYVLQLFYSTMPIVEKLANFRQNGAVAVRNYKLLLILCSSINFSCGGDEQNRSSFKTKIFKTKTNCPRVWFEGSGGMPG